MADEPGDLSISVQLRARDVRWAGLQFLLKWQVLAVWAILICGVVYVAIKGDPTQVYVSGGAIVFCYGLLPWLLAAMSMRNPIVRFPCHHTFSTTGITSKFQGGNVGLDWQLVSKARETRRYVAIWGRGGLPMVMPKNQLTEDDLSSLRSRLAFHLPGRARLNASK